MLIYFHEIKFLCPFAPDAPPAPWVAHWTREMMIERDFIRSNTTIEEERLSKSESESQENKIKNTPVIKRKQPERVAKTPAQPHKETEQAKDNAAKRRKRALEMIREKRSKKRNDGAQSANVAPDLVPTVNMDSEQLLQTQGSSTPSVNAASNTRPPLALSFPSSVQEELMKDDFIYVRPQKETQQTSNNDRPLEQQQQPCEEPTTQQSKQEAPVDVAAQPRKREDERPSFSLGINPPASQPTQPFQESVSQLEIQAEAVVDAEVTATLKLLKEHLQNQPYQWLKFTKPRRKR
ncbi:hypothetical protein AHAS_Ahas10G0102500 [Arachis hypogaea]